MTLPHDQSSTNKSGNRGQIQLGIWGAKGAGKTAYLGKMIPTMEAEGRWSIKPHGDETLAFFRNITGDLEQGAYPAGTDIQEPHLYQFQVRLHKKNPEKDVLEKLLGDRLGNNIWLNFVDAAGEIYEDTARVDYDLAPLLAPLFAPGSSERMSILDYLSLCHGILILIDPEHRTIETKEGMVLSYTTMFRELFVKLLDHFTDPFDPPQYFAFCFTKIDKSGFSTLADQPKEVAKSILGENIETWLQGYLGLKDQFEFFNVSVVGLPDDPSRPNQSSKSEAGDSAPILVPRPSRTTGNRVDSLLPPGVRRQPSAPAASGNDTIIPVDSTDSKGSAAPATPPRPSEVMNSTSGGHGDRKRGGTYRANGRPYKLTEPLNWLLRRIVDDPLDLNNRPRSSPQS